MNSLGRLSRRCGDSLLAIVLTGAVVSPGCAASTGPARSLPGGFAGKVVRHCQPPGRSLLPRGWTVAPSRSRVLRTGLPQPAVETRRRGLQRTTLDPVLADLLSGPATTDRVAVLVTFDERVPIPRFPARVDSLPDKAPENQARLRAARARIAEIRGRRARAYRAEVAALGALPGARVTERFWLAPVFAVELPVASLSALQRVRGVATIEAAVGHDAPPACPEPDPTPDNGYNDDDVAAALQVIRSETYRGTGIPRGRVSLLDTGVWTQHLLLRGATLGVLADCVHGGEDCLDASLPEFDPGDQSRDGRGHGTSSAAILVGTDAMGPRWRGGLDVVLDSYQVFDSGDCGVSQRCLSRLATIRAFEAAVARLSRVIVANCVANGLDDVFGTCVAAENAYRAGAVVVAANGDKGPGARTVGAPATAPKVIGVGSRPMGALDLTEEVQSSGPAEGERLKPDIQAPSWSETARYDWQCTDQENLLRGFTGTSGATPFAGVAASMLRDWMKTVDPDLDPGHVYAGLILSGRSYGTQVNNRQGAGLIQLPTNCCAWFGAEDVFEGTTREFSINLGGTGADRLEVALWWPENQIIGEPDDTPLQHNNVDLEIVDPSGTVRATSHQVWGVFERATATTGGTEGNWTIRIVGGDFFAHGRDGGFPSPEIIEPNHSQRVYWAAAARRPGEASPP